MIEWWNNLEDWWKILAIYWLIFAPFLAGCWCIVQRKAGDEA